MRAERGRILRWLFVLVFLTAALALSGCGAGKPEKGNEAAAAGREIEGETANAESGQPGGEAVDAGVENPGGETANAESGQAENENTNTSSSELTVQFLDVGQGSSALVHQDGRFMLIDGGDREYSSYVVSFLKQQGVERLDYVVVSHYDSDHLNGIVGVLNVFECGQVLAPDYEGDTKVYQSFRSIIDEKQIPLTYPGLGETYEFAQSSFRVVSPGAYQYKDVNANSLGIRLAYGSSSFLICGDCTAESEQDLLYLGVDLDSDVFAANHHGSRYSNCREFLEAVSPKDVVISCGLGNSYGHPDASVLLSIQELGANLYRTDLQGVITAVSDGTNVRFDTEPSMDYRSGAELSGEDAAQTAGNEPKAAGSETGAADNEAGGAGEVEAAPKDYVLNNSTRKFHRPDCGSVNSIKASNRKDVRESRDVLIQQGYEPCKKCNP